MIARNQMQTELNQHTVNLKSADSIKRGRFTHCYLFHNYAVLYSIDILKECSALYSFTTHDDNPHLPEIDRFDGLDKWYIMPRYLPLTKQHTKAWQQYRALQKLLNVHRSMFFENPRYTIDKCYKFAEIVKQYDEKLGEALSAIVDNVSNGSSNLMFEFPKSNLAVDNDGNLILLDVIFNLDYLRQGIKLSSKLRKQFTTE